MLKFLFAAAVLAGSLPAFASELVLLPITDLQHQRTELGEQLVVTMDFQACKYSYKGLYLKQVASGQGQQRFEVHALATERVPGSCDGPVEPRTDSLIVSTTSTDRFDFIAAKPAK